MSPSAAAVICWTGIAGLFYLNRDKSVTTSKALWLPVTWFWIIGSRPVSAWLGISHTGQEQLEGSPTDALAFGLLLAAGLLVLIRRSTRTRALLRANSAILVYFAYCLLSVVWAIYPALALKKWTKAIGDLVMVLVVVTDGEPIVAFQRFLSRTGFVLFPNSLLFIKYFDGVGFTMDGGLSVVGVTDNKNTLGVVVMVISLGTLWRLFALLRAGRRPNRGRHLVAQGTLLAFGVALLVLAHSATSVACFALGGTVIFATSLPALKRDPTRVHGFMLLLSLTAGITMLFGGKDDVVHALGRKSSFTGRTDIWNAVIPAAPNAVIGAGFESFWIAPDNVAKVVRYLRLHGWQSTERGGSAHNGYIEVYINLGMVGVGLIALILISGYRHGCAAAGRQSEIGGVMLAYVPVTAIYSVTEPGFRMLHPMWFFFLLAIIFASGISKGSVKALPPIRPGLPRFRNEGQPLGWSHQLLIR